MKQLYLILVLATDLTFSGAASAGLIDRGDGLIYDDVLDVTWLQAANYVHTSGFAAENAVDNGPSSTDNIEANGSMGWTAAVDWADQLVFGGFDDWRLPWTPQTDSSCVTPSSSSGGGCTGSEMGHLFHVDGISMTSPGLFTNLQNIHWSGSDFSSDLTEALAFNFSFGGQWPVDKNVEFFAWAVRDGDISSEPPW